MSGGKADPYGGGCSPSLRYGRVFIYKQRGNIKDKAGKRVTIFAEHSFLVFFLNCEKICLPQNCDEVDFRI